MTDSESGSPKKEIKHASANVVKISVYDSAHEYAKAGRIDAFTELLESHVDDDTFIDHLHTKSGTTWLTAAAAEGQIDIVNLLLESECSIDLQDGKGNTALIQAAFHGFDGGSQLLDVCSVRTQLSS
jgi:ankyrin repeat protein